MNKYLPFEARRIWSYRLLSLLLTIFSFSSVGFSQTAEQCFRGTVNDLKNGLIIGAEVSLKDKTGKLIYKTETNESGAFYLNCFDEGEYKLSVSKKGMIAFEKNITLKKQNAEVSEIVLEMNRIEESVTVKIEPEYSVSESESATKTATPLRDIPQSVEIVNQQLMQSQAVRSLQDALNNVTAVSVAQGEGRRDQFFIRGFSAIGDQFVDGVRDDAQYYRDLANIEKIEVIKGPAAVLFGRGSSGGLINRITKRPDYFGRIGSADLTLGLFGLKRGSVDFGQPILKERTAFRFIGAYEDSRSFRSFFFQKRISVAPSLSWKPTEKTDVLFQIEFLRDERLPDRGIPSYQGRPVDVSIGTYYGFPELDRIINRVNSQAIKIEHRINSDWLVRNNFRRAGFDNAFYNTLPGAVFASNGQLRVARSQYNGTNKQQNYFNQTETVGNVNFLGWRHTILTGIELGLQNKDSVTFRNGTASSVALINPVLTRPSNNGIATTKNNFKAKVIGIYFQDQFVINKNWKALVGARFDRFKQELDDLLPINVDLQRIDKQWSPRVGLVYQPNEWLSFYGSYTRSFQPSGENLSLAENNKELEPEITRNYEMGVKAQYQPFRLKATVSVFQLDRNNIKTTDPLNPAKLILVGEQRSRGMEITVSGTPIGKLEIYGGYALLDARITKSNNVSSGVSLQGRLAQLTPRNSGNLWLTYQLPKQFRLGWGAFARTKIYTSANNLVVLPGFVRFDASLAWRSERHYEISLNVKNLLNRRYYETANGDNNITPGASLNGSVTLRYRW